jgi:hypothetical protein
MADKSLGNDLVNAVVSALQADKALYEPLGVYGMGNTLRAENARAGAGASIRGQNGTCSVSVNGMEVEQSYDESALVRYDLGLSFDMLETRLGISSSALLSRALIRTFGDGGPRMLAHLTQTTTARLGGSGSTILGKVDTMPGDVPSRIVANVTLECRMWTTLTQVEIP